MDLGRQLKKDFDQFCVLGFIMSLNILPSVLAKKEDALAQDDIDFADIEKGFADAMEKLKIVYRNTPQVKVMIGGNFLDMVERGIIKMDL